MEIYALLKENEGLRLKMYDDTKGIATIGYGHNLEARPITEPVAELMLQEDVQITITKLRRLHAYTKCNVARKSVLIDMAYTLGFGGLLEFHQFLRAVEGEDYQRAYDEILSSKWAKEARIRAKRDALIMLRGTL